MDPSQYNYMHTNDDQYNVAPNAFHPLYGGGASEAGNYHSDGTSGAENYPYHGGVAISGLSPTLGGEGVDYEQFITDYFNGLSYQNSVDASEINQVQWSDPNGTGVPNSWEGYCDHQNAFGPQYGGSGSSTYHYDTASAHMENTSEEEECNFFDFDYESEPEVYDICVEVAMEQELALINTILEVGLASIPKKKQKIPLHTASGKGYDWVMHILQSNHPDKCPRTFSLTRDAYLLLCRELVERYGFRTSRRSAVGILESVGMYLCLLRGMDLKQIDELFDRGTSTVSRQIRKVLRCLERMAVDQIHPWTDQGEVHPYLTSREMYGPFKNCIGAIDGTHVFCKPPKGKAKNFWGRKGGYTMNIMAVVDFNLCFTFAAAGYEGSMHDYKIFKDVVYGPKKDRFPHPEPDKYYLVDAGYPNRPGYLAPYKGYRYHLEDFRRGRRRQPRNDEEFFNRVHSSLRSCIERPFGVWKARWDLMKMKPSYNFEGHTRIVLTSMAIHNFIRRNCPTDEYFEKADMEMEDYVFVDLPDVANHFADADDEDGQEQDEDHDPAMGHFRDLLTNKLRRYRPRNV